MQRMGSMVAFAFGITLALLACGDSKLKTPASGGQSANTAREAERPAPAAVTSAKVFYFGHSLVGHDLPQMIGSMARARNAAYTVHGQIGFGTPLMAHWRWHGAFDSGFVPPGFRDELPGSLLFEVEGHAALASGAYDVVVLTETNDFASGSPGAWNTRCDPNSDFGGCTIESAIDFVRLSRQHNGAVRILLYTNWKDIGELGGVQPWLADIDAHVGWWEHVADRVDEALAGEGVRGSTIRVVPAAPIVARIVREAEAGELEALGLPDRAPLFRDTVHLSRLGFYLVALAHYAVIYEQSPIGLPSTVDVVTDDKKALAPNGLVVDPKLAAHFQEVVWDVLKAYPRAGITAPAK